MKVTNLCYIHQLKENEVILHKNTFHLFLFKGFKENKMSKETVILESYFNNKPYEKIIEMNDIKENFINTGIYLPVLKENNLSIFLENIKIKFFKNNEIDLENNDFFIKNKKYKKLEDFYQNTINNLVIFLETYLNENNQHY